MTRNRKEKPNTKFENLSFAGKYSMKNIPIPSNSEYMKKLIAQMEKIIRRMRWKALFFLKEKDEKQNQNKPQNGSINSIRCSNTLGPAQQTHQNSFLQPTQQPQKQQPSQLTESTISEKI